MRGLYIFCAVLLIASLNQALCSSVPDDLHGNAERLKISGTHAFSPEQIKDALSRNVEFVEPIDGDVSLKDYLGKIERLIVKGYRHAGFRDVVVKADANTNPDTIAVSVKEGSRYLSGDIRVKGGKTFPVAELIARLTRSYPPKDAVAESFGMCNGEAIVNWVDANGEKVDLNDAVWRPGEPTIFPPTPSDDSELRKEIAHALANIGYYFARFTVDFDVDKETRKAHLVISISDEGPRCTFDGVHIMGNEVNKSEEILEYISFKPGSPATQEELIRLQSKLWHSGRFINSKVQLYRPVTEDDSARLWIDVTELNRAPPLREPLSRVENLLLKCRDYISDSAQWKSDLVVRHTSDAGLYEIILSPGKGTIIAFSCDGPKREKAVGYAAVASREEIGAYCTTEGRKIVAHPVNQQLFSYIRQRLDDNANHLDEGRARLLFGFGVKSELPQSGMPFELHIILDPVCFLDLAHRPEATYEIKDGILTISADHESYRLDAESGKLIEFRLYNQPDSDNAEQEQYDTVMKGDSEASKPSQMTISFVSGEYQRRLKTIHDSTANVPNKYDSRRPLSSILRFVFEDDRFIRHLGVMNQRVSTIIAGMLDQNVCEPFDNMAVKYLSDDKYNPSGGDNESFLIIPESHGVASDKKWYVSKDIASNVFFFTHELFRRGSWPELLGRTCLLRAYDRREAVVLQLQRIIDSEESGPLCCLTFSVLSQWLGMPTAGISMAGHGHRRLSIEDYRRDCRIFLDSEYPFGQFMIRVADQIRKMNDSDVEAIASLLPDQCGDVFKRWIQQTRENPTQSTEQSLSLLLDDIWRIGLRESVREALHLLSVVEMPSLTRNGF